MCSKSFVIAIFIASYFCATGYCQNENDPVGDYLFKGGIGLLSIVRDSSGELHCKDYFFLSDCLDGEIRMEHVQPQIFLTFTADEKTVEIYSLNENNRHILMHFSQSNEHGSDYDLVYLDHRLHSIGKSTPLTDRKRGYLHRVDDSRVVRYYEKVESLSETEDLQETLEQLLVMARDIVQDNPDDKLLRAIYFDALLRIGAREELSEALQGWAAHYQDDGSYPSLIFQQAKVGLYGLNLSYEKRNAYDLLEELYSCNRDNNSREETLRLLPKLLYYEEMQKPITIIPGNLYENSSFIQQRTKVICAEAKLLCLQGKREKALDLLLAGAYTGVLMGSEEKLIDFLLSIAVQRTVYWHLEFFIENCCMSPVYLGPIRAQLDRFWKKTSGVTHEDILGFYYMKMDDLASMTNFLTLLTRYNVSLSELQQIRTGAAAKLYQVSNGNLPDGTQQLEPLFPEGLPEDPFGDRIKYKRTYDGCIAYSIGPDGEDNGGMLQYDPTNGTISAGDIFFSISDKPKYPIPAWGVRAWNAEDLLRQFPDGLPLDIFNTNGLVPLSVKETDRLYLYSIGPDNTESWVHRGESNVEEPISYDPTNGVVSDGDIFFVVPQP